MGTGRENIGEHEEDGVTRPEGNRGARGTGRAAINIK